MLMLLGIFVGWATGWLTGNSLESRRKRVRPLNGCRHVHWWWSPWLVERVSTERFTKRVLGAMQEKERERSFRVKKNNEPFSSCNLRVS